MSSDEAVHLTRWGDTGPRLIRAAARGRALTGGWSPAFEAVGDAVATAGAGKRLVVPSEHHFPHLASDAFNEAWVEFVEGTPGAAASGPA